MAIEFGILLCKSKRFNEINLNSLRHSKCPDQIWRCFSCFNLLQVPPHSLGLTNNPIHLFAVI